MTDGLTFILSFVFLILGASRGFILSLIVPLSIIIATIISIIYYQITNEIIVSLLIGLIGPMLLNILLKFLLKTWIQSTNAHIKPGFFSRLGGALLTLAWGWVFIVFTLILLAVIPPWGDTLKAVHDDVTGSFSYMFAKPLGESLFGGSKQTEAPATNAPSNNDAKSLAEDPRFQKVLQDPEIQHDIDTHNMVKLMSNPKMMDLTRQIMSDPATMKKIMALYSHQAPQKAALDIQDGYSTVPTSKSSN